MIETVPLISQQKESLIDITSQVVHLLRMGRVVNGVVTLFTPDAGTGLVICSGDQRDTSRDIFDLLGILIPEGVWLHDRGCGGADAHLKSALGGSSESIPFMNGSLALGPDQKIFFCDFDGPRRDRKVVCSVISDR